MKQYIPSYELYRTHDGKKVLRINRINGRFFGRNIAARIGRAIDDVGDDKTVYNFAKTLKRHKIDLVPRFNEGELKGFTYAFAGGSVAASAIAPEVTPKGLQEAGFRLSNTQEELDWLKGQGARETTGLISRKEAGRVGLSTAKKDLAERSELIKRGLDRKYSDDARQVLALTPMKGGWGDLEVNDLAGAKVYEQSGNVIQREAYSANTAYWKPSVERLTDAEDIFNVIGKLENAVIVGGVAADPGQLRAKAIRRKLTFENAFNPEPPDDLKRAQAHLKPYRDVQYMEQRGDFADVPEDVMKRVRAGEILVEDKNRQAPEITTHRKRWLMIDVDDQQLPDGMDAVKRPQEAARWYIENALPEEFRQARVGVQLSSSAGFEKIDKRQEGDRTVETMAPVDHAPKASLHLFFETSEAHYPEDVHAYLEKHAKARAEQRKADDIEIKTDFAVIRDPHQVHYVVDPVFKNFQDPLAGKRLTVAPGEMCVKLPKHVDGMIFEDPKFMERGVSTPFKPVSVDQSDAQRELSEAPHHPPMSQTGSGQSLPSKAAVKADGHQFRIPALTATGGQELRAQLAALSQNLWHQVYEADPWTPPPGGAGTQHLENRIVAELRQFADDAAARGVGSPSTHNKLTDSEFHRLAPDAAQTAFRKHGVPTYQSFAKMADCPEKREMAASYMSGIRSLRKSSSQKVVVDPRDGVEVVASRLAGDNVIREDSVTLVDKGVAVAGHAAKSKEDVLVIGDQTRFFAALETETPAVGVFGDPEAKDVVRAIKEASKKPKAFSMNRSIKVPKLRFHKSMPEEVRSRLSAELADHGMSVRDWASERSTARSGSAFSKRGTLSRGLYR